MYEKAERKPYRIIGVYDSETSNIDAAGMRGAFPCLHQLGIIGDDIALTDITPDNVEDVVKLSMFRHAIDLYGALDALAGADLPYIPVICCHNLSFDMYGLSPWLESNNVQCLAKSRRKPITFTICDESGERKLVLWDTLVFSGQPLSRMGFDCGYSKAIGEWDYNLIRTPETPLTDEEIEYAARDVYTLFAWLGWWLRNNPDIEPDKLALHVVTKTGVVRERRKKRFNAIKGADCKNDIGSFWLYRNRTQSPLSDDELFSMIACTRGGFTFCAESSAGIPYELDGTTRSVIGYDATSQHPAQMVSHKYPLDFHVTRPDIITRAFNVIASITVEQLLSDLEKPFFCAFNAKFRITNIRPKKSSIYEKFGIVPLASARFSASPEFVTDDNEQQREYAEKAREIGYADTCVNGVFSFGKLSRADSVEIWLTELAAWEVSHCYDFDSVECLHGYFSTRFARPTDLALVSVMQFFKAKNEFKAARKEYYATGTVSNGAEMRQLGITESIVSAMETGECLERDVESTYLSLKADLNALFGIEACNEYRRDTVMTPYGIDFEDDFGICNKPKNPKAWYQFGQRIVGWSRIAQIIVMELISPYAISIINGDTDSIKILADECDKLSIDEALSRYAAAIDKAHESICHRVKYAYPERYDDLAGIGHYVEEFNVKEFCASWNKAYVTREVDKDGEKHCKFTIAGIPARLGVDMAADQFIARGMSFNEVSSIFLGYNVLFSHSITFMNGRAFPEWGSAFVGNVTDYQGCTVTVREPAALALFPMEKISNDTAVPENRSNCRIALRNNPDINTDRIIIGSNQRDMNDSTPVRYEIIETGL